MLYIAIFYFLFTVVKQVMPKLQLYCYEQVNTYVLLCSLAW